MWDWEIVLGAWPKLIEASGITLQLTLISSLIGFALALLIALSWYKKIPFLSQLFRGFVFFFRGTPLLVQIFLIYYGLGQYSQVLEDIHIWWVFKEAYFCGLFALTLNTAAYTAILIEGAIKSVPQGEIEAATSLGMNSLLVITRILLPRAFRFIIPAYGNEVILLLKATSLVSTITVMDLMGMASKVASDNFAPIEAFVTAGAIYLCFTFVFTFAFRWVERRTSLV